MPSAPVVIAPPGVLMMIFAINFFQRLFQQTVGEEYSEEETLDDATNDAVAVIVLEQLLWR